MNNEVGLNAGALSHEKAIRIEETMRHVFDSDRYAKIGRERIIVGGLIDSGTIQRHPFWAMMCTLTHLNNYLDIEEEIGSFFERYSLAMNYSIDDFLYLEAKKLDQDKSNEEVFENMVGDFKNLCE